MSLGSLIPRLPRALWAIEAGSLLTYFGSGLILPFEVIYFHDQRGFSLEASGVIAGTFPAFALVGSVLGGPLVDRFGARRCMAAALLAGGCGTGTLAFVTTPWQALLANALLGLIGGVFVPARATLIASLAGPVQRHAAYGLQFAVMNLGIAGGTGVGGLIAHSSTLAAYQALFLGNAVATVSFALVVLLLTGKRSGAPEPEAAVAERGGRYRDLLRHRALLGFIGITALIGLAGLALFEVALPVFASKEEGLDERTIGFVFLVNSLAIVLFQLPATRLLEGRRRLHAVALALSLWTVAWLLVAIGAPHANGAGDVLLFVAVVVLFALGECLIAPVQGALVFELAPERLQGRCLAAHSCAYAGGMTIGPPLVGVLLARQPSLVWLGGAGLLAFAAAAALALDRRVPEAVRRTPFADRLGRAKTREVVTLPQPV